MPALWSQKQNHVIPPRLLTSSRCPAHHASAALSLLTSPYLPSFFLTFPLSNSFWILPVRCSQLAFQVHQLGSWSKTWAALCRCRERNEGGLCGWQRQPETEMSPSERGGLGEQLAVVELWSPSWAAACSQGGRRRTLRARAIPARPMLSHP